MYVFSVLFPWCADINILRQDGKKCVQEPLPLVLASDAASGIPDHLNNCIFEFSAIVAAEDQLSAVQSNVPQIFLHV